MGLFKHTIAINGLDYGASETMYFQRQDDDILAADAATFNVVQKRAMMLGRQHFIKASRIQLIRTQNGLTRKRTGYLRKLAIPGSSSFDSCAPNLRLQAMMKDASAQRTKLTFLSGCWDAIFPQGNLYFGQAGGFQSYFNAWAGALIALGYGWLADTGEDEASLITGYSFDPASGHTVYALAPGGIQWPEIGRPYRVDVEFPLSRSPLDGTQIVIPTSPTSAITAKPRPAGPFVVQGTMKLRGSSFVSLATTNNQGNPGSVLAQNAMTHKSGRPLYTSRGRSAPIARW